MKTRKISLFLLISQVLFHLILTFSSVAQAVELSQENHQREVLAKIKSSLPDLNSQPDELNTRSNDDYFADAASKAGNILSSDRSDEAARNLIEANAYGILNNQMTNWLNQYGHSRVSIGTKSTTAIDFLFPLSDTQDSLLFYQTRFQRKDETRTTFNFGLGYRQFSDDWMWGVNSFYDYDFKNNNQRWGAGLELGADYLKLAANGYFRLSDWRQSKLKEFADYNERPANGVDIRFEGYLPGYPQLGANLRYEKYFGKGVNLANSNSASDLKDSPQAYNVGVSYTPFPLLSFKVNQSMGDLNETKGTMELNYRFNVPISQQVDPSFVSSMRSLQGSRYDFVNRNYDIVMQYQKQTLLQIALPVWVNGQSKQTIFVPLTVKRAKYAIKDIEWDTSSLIAKGGGSTSSSVNGIYITLPEYDNDGTNIYPLSVTVTDEKGNKADAATNIEIEQINAAIEFVVEPNTDVVANGEDYYTATVTVTDKTTGKPLVNTNVSFSSQNVTLYNDTTTGGQSLTVTTSSSGKAVIKIKSTVAQTVLLNATLEDNTSASKSLTFIANAKTAAVTKIVLNGDVVEKVADGVNYFTFTATVMDNNSNPVPIGTVVTWTQDKGSNVVLSATASETDERGKATITLTSTTKAVEEIQVSAQAVANASAVNADKKVNFIGDITKAVVTTVALDGTETSKVADGVNYFTFTATVMDNNSNPVPIGTVVTWTQDKGSNVVLSATASETDERGKATITLTSTTKAVEEIQVSAQAVANASAVNADKKVNFIGDITKAMVTTVALDGTETSKVADGVNYFTFTATVMDNNSNPVPIGTVVTWTQDKGSNVVLSATASETDERGKATITLTSTTKAVEEIQVSAQAVANASAVNADKKVNFIGDITKAVVTTVALDGTETSKVADGVNYFTFTATVMDNNSNPVPIGTVVTWTQDKGSNVVLSATASETDERGKATITLTSTTKAVEEIQVSAQAVANASAVNADKKVNFIGDITKAVVTTVALDGTETSKVADGVNYFTFTATVMDNNSNPAPIGTVVTWTQDKGSNVVLSATASQTDERGKATITLTSTTKAVEEIQVSAQAVANTSAVNADKKVNFIGDITKAVVTTVALDGTETSKVADGVNYFTFTATVMDNNSNPVPIGTVVTWTQDKGSNVVLSATASQTDERGKATITLTSTTKAVEEIQVSAQAVANASAVNADKKVNFIGDITKAVVTTVALDGTETSKVADGVSYFTFTATVMDNNSNPVPIGTVVTWAQDKGSNVVLSATASQTDERGKATITLTSTTKAVEEIQVSAQAVANASAVNADKKVNFISNTNKASVTSVVLNGTETSKVADGVNYFTFTATVMDNNSNPVPIGTVVTWTQDKGSNVVLSATASQTDERGKATITLTSTTKAVEEIQVSAQAVANASAVNADKKVNFIGDITKAMVTTVALDGTETSKVADGVNYFTFTATVMDNNSNPVPIGTVVTWTQDKGSNVVLSATASQTDERGKATITLTSTTKAVEEIQVSAQAVANASAVNADKKVNFISNTNKASVTSVVLNGTETSKVADGVNYFTFTATVMDNNSNPAPIGTVVTWTQDKGSNVVLSATASQTDERGKATITLTSTTKAVEEIQVSAQAVANASAVNADKKVNFIGDITKAVVTTVVLDGTETSKVADGVNYFTFTATVMDNNSNPVPIGTVVTWTQDKGSNVVLSATASETDERGKATITLTSTTKAVEEIQVSAQAVANASAVNADKKVNFIGDITKAVVTTVALDGTETSKVADGVNYFTFTATVMDNNSNPVPIGTVVTWTQDKGSNVVLSATASETDERGKATITLTSTTKAVEEIQVSAQAVANASAVNADKKVNFIGDITKAVVTTVALDGTETSKVADGVNYFTFTATVMDNNSNPVPIGTVVTWTQDKGSNVVLSATASETDERGKATITLTSTTKAVEEIQVSAQAVANASAVNADKKVNFIGDITKAVVTTVALDGTETSKVADGVNYFTFTATVMDNNSNPVPIGTVVTWAQDKGSNVVLSATASETDERGKATITLTSTTKAVEEIQVSAQAVANASAVNADKKVNFIGDITKAVVTTVALDGTETSKVADGVNYFTFTATVMDNNSNPVPIGTVVTWTQDKGSNVVLSATASETDERGKATITLTSTTKAVEEIQVSAQAVANASAVNADKKVNFIGDITKAVVTTVALDGTETSKVADGVNYFTFTATVMDNNSNPVPIGTVVTWAQDKGSNVVLSATASETDERGKATITLTSTTKAVEEIQVSAQAVANASAVNADKKVNFIGDITKAVVTTVALDGTETSKVADGVNYFTFTATVMDNNSNPVPIGTVVTWAQDKGSNVVLSATASQTDERGKATITLTSTTKAVEEIQVSAQAVANASAVNADKKVNFIGDITKAVVTTVALDGTETSKVADGVNYFTFTATVMDNNSNPVPIGTVVTWTQDKGSNVVLSATASETDERGKATITLTSTTKAVEEIQVSAQAVANASAVNADKKVNFIADVNTAKVKKVTLVDTETRKFANGSDSFVFEATIVDTNGNLITDSGVNINWKTNDTNATLSSVSSLTDTYGKATITLTSTTTAAHNVVLSANTDTNTNYINADKTVSFVSLTFTLTPADKYYVAGVYVEYIVTAIPSDGSDNIIVSSSDSTWSSSNTSIAPIDKNGTLTTSGTEPDSSIISATGQFNLIDYNVSTNIYVRPSITIGLYGIANGTDNTMDSYKISAPSYQIYVRADGIIDALGSDAGASSGGTGGQPYEAPLENLSSIKITWGNWSGDPQRKRLLQLIFTLKDGTVYSYGKSGPDKNYSNLESDSYTVPDSYQLQGINVVEGPAGPNATESDKSYISQVGFIFIDPTVSD